MLIASDIKYIGVNDNSIDLFEGMYHVPDGISYNSYVILDEKIAILDTVDAGFTESWLKKLQISLEGRIPDYLIVQHMEPDHSANVLTLLLEYPDTTVVASAKAFEFMKHFFGKAFEQNRIIVSDGDTLCLGRHTLKFISAMMVHWPEVIMTYDETEKILFSADAFGKFGMNDTESMWLNEARRYYFGIVGKYGASVQKLLQKIASLDIRKICSLHGTILHRNLQYYIDKYDTWSKYLPEEEGILIAYTSIYGNTKHAVYLLAEELKTRGCERVEMRDLARCDMSEVVAAAFRYSKLVLATTTYNTGIFPYMREFIHWLTERNYSNRRIAFMENGSWRPVAAKQMKDLFCSCSNLQFAETSVQILSALDEDSRYQIIQLAEELIME